MSWAEEDWTVGLSGRVLQKVKELQVHQERLSRENKQKQLQLDNIHTSLEKQTAKYDEVRVELQSVHRELQSARDEAKAAATSRERLAQELQTKQAQVCSFEGQLEAARTLNNKLTQEVKRLEAELEKLQNSSRSADTTPFSTPCWNTASPWEHSGSRKEERPGHRDAGQGWASNSRQRLQFSEVASDSLPRQQYKNTPHRHPSDQSDLFSTPSAAFPWERDDSRPAAKRRSPPSPLTPCADVITPVQSDQGGCGKERDNRTETDMSSALRTRVSALEEELSAKAGMLKSIQSEMVQNKKELAARELSVQRARDELGLAHTRMAQESERASGAEQRLKQLQEELKCQRQNTESSRLQHQQRSKELEKQHQRDLTELQKERQCLEKQHQQEVNKLNVELQQARTLHNALQAQADKLSLQKQALDKELDTLKEKLKWTEGQLQESQKKEAQTQAKLTEAVREAEGVAVCLEQSRKRERALEEEGRRLAEEQADALRLLKELQEQKAAPEPLPPPVPSFSTQPSYSFHSRPSTNVKRSTSATVAEQKKDENDDRRRAEIAASYPSDREPGEGIDSEHITALISTDERRKNSKEEESKSRNEEIESDSSETNKHSSFDRVLPSFSHSDSGTHTITSEDGDRCTSGLSAENTPPMSEQAKAFEELKRENALLRSELQDKREELQKRLEDLEGQRRAEAEARTRLKQLSRKQASQSVEQEEQEKEWRSQLESAKAETERLRKALVALEAEAKGGRKERENLEREEQEEEKKRALQDRESEMIELNMQLKKQLSEVKAQLTLEREERKREEEERNQINTDVDVKKELSMKLEELQAELEELKRGRKEDSPEEENPAAGNSPLTYLTLRDDELNSNMVHCDNKPPPSPEQHLLFCQSANQRNTLVSQATADLIQGERMVIDAERSQLSEEEQTSDVTSDLEDARQNNLLGASPSLESLSDSQKDEPASVNLTEEVERLRRENAKESERAHQCQVKLEALQSQVTRQTQQLSTAFEKQSQHISGLLTELQEKESALLSQGEELQRYKQELDALKGQTEGQEVTVKNVGDGKQKEEEEEKPVEISGLQPNQDSVFPTNSPADCDSKAQRDEGQPEVMAPDATTSQHLTADVVVELLALRQENQQLKQRIEGSTVSDASDQSSHTDGENREDPVKQSQNSGNVTPSCMTEESSPIIPNDTTSESPLPDVTSQDGGGELEGEDKRTARTEEELEAVCQLHMKRLQQQVVELRMKVHALSEETQQQAEELAVWRLASQPAPAFSDNQQTDETNPNLPAAPHLDVQESPGHMTVVREDELLLSGSSNKLQGRMLFSRLQHSNLPEPKTLHPSKKTSALHEYNQDSAKIDKDSEKENQDINLLHQSNIAQRQKKDTDVIQVIPEKTGQQDVTKDLHKVSGPKQSRTAEGPQAKPDPARDIITTNDSSGTDVRTEMKSASSQTDESLCLRGASAASQLHCVYTQTEQEDEEEEEEEEEEVVESPPVSPVSVSEGAAFGDKMLFSGSFPIPADPARLAERIRRNRTQLSAAFDDTEYEPYGLPEVVMKGFADIPSGPSCPYIVRRGLLGTTVVPVPPKTQEQVEETD